MKKMFSNPLPIYDNDGKIYNGALPDPYIMKYRGVYYCYTTGTEGVPVLKSPDLLHFKYIGMALTETTEWEYWAPCVVYSNGTFYMYYSSRNKESDNPHDQRMKVAISKKPEGPFEYCKTLSETFCIDADVQIFPDGRWGIFYATNDFHGNDLKRPGTTIAFEEMTSPFEMSGKAADIISATNDREIFARNRFGDGRDWHTIEAPCYYKSGCKEFLMYSGNAYTSKDYFVDYSLKSNTNIWEKRECNSESVLLHACGRLVGTGHNSVIEGPNGIDKVTVFHGMTELSEGTYQDTRKICAARITNFGDKLSIIGNPSEELRLFANAAIKDFDEYSNNNLAENWSSDFSGNVRKSIKGNSISLINRSVLISKNRFIDYHMEVWCRSLDKIGEFGIYASYIDSENYSEIVIIPEKHTLCLINVHDGIECREKRSFSFIDFGTYQLLKVVKCGGAAEVYINNTPVGTLIVEPGPRNIGFSTLYSEAFFSGFSLTEYLEITKSNYPYTQNKIRPMTNATAIIQDGDSLKCTGTPFTVPVAIKIPYELKLDFSFNELDMSLQIPVKNSNTPLTVIMKSNEISLVHNGVKTKSYFDCKSSSLLISLLADEIVISNGENSISLSETCNGDIVLQPNKHQILSQITITAN